MTYFTGWKAIIENVRALPCLQRLVVAAAEDEHTLAAVKMAVDRGLAAPVLVGDKKRVLALAESVRLPIEPPDVYDAADADAAARIAVALIREKKGDFLMKGALETRQLLHAVVDKTTGLSRERLMSHNAFFEVPGHHKMLLVTDGGMVIYPALEQKKEIIENAVALLRSFGYSMPKVAVLAGIEKVNPKMPETLDGAALKEMNRQGTITGCIVEGPISLDIALTREKARIKGFESEVAGDADILVVPNLCAGNLICKTLTELAGAKLAGLVTGARVPIVLTSRGATAEEKYLSVVLAAGAVGHG